MAANTQKQTYLIINNKEPLRWTMSVFKPMFSHLWDVGVLLIQAPEMVNSCTVGLL
jgi:hypothetical protein